MLKHDKPVTVRDLDLIWLALTELHAMIRHLHQEITQEEHLMSNQFDSLVAQFDHVDTLLSAENTDIVRIESNIADLKDKLANAGGLTATETATVQARLTKAESDLADAKAKLDTDAEDEATPEPTNETPPSQNPVNDNSA